MYINTVLCFPPSRTSAFASILSFIMSAPGLSPQEQAAQAAAAAAAEQFNVEAFTLLGVGLFITILRTYTLISTVGLRRLDVDDYLIWFAAVWLLQQPMGMMTSTNTFHSSAMLLRLLLPTM